MIGIEIVNYPMLLAFWLAFSRNLAIMIQLPLFDNTSIPQTVKVMITLIITYTFFPNISSYMLADINVLGTNSFWILTIFNVVIGLAIGFLVKAILQIFMAAGSIITQQIGFGAIRYFDPTTTQQIGPFEKLISWTLLVMIISTGALLPMFEGMIGSFQSINYSTWNHTHDFTAFFNIFFKGAFTTSLMLASPLIFTNILIMSVLGIIARVVPQMNVLMVSFVVNIGLGLLVFWACSEEFFQTGYKLYVDKLGEWFQFIT